MKSWYLHWKASRASGRGDFESARALYERIVAADARDGFARLMLAACHEREGDYAEALRLADDAIRVSPEDLPALQTAARIAIAAEEHERAEDYILRALSLPEMRTEMPDDMAAFNVAARILRILARVPLLRRKLRPDAVQAALRHLDAGHRSEELAEWKRWALEYIGDPADEEGGAAEPLVH